MAALAALLPSLTRTPLMDRATVLAGLLLMGARDPRTRKGNVFKGSNGLARAKPANATGWWHRLRSLGDIPLAQPPVAGGAAASGGVRKAGA